MIGQQQHIPYDGGVWDSFAEMDALEKARNARLKKAREVNASAEAFAQVKAGLDVVLDRLAGNNPTAAPQAVQGAALVDRLTNENNLLKIENANLKLQLVQLKQRLGAK